MRAGGCRRATEAVQPDLDCFHSPDEKGRMPHRQRLKWDLPVLNKGSRLTAATLLSGAPMKAESAQIGCGPAPLQQSCPLIKLQVCTPMRLSPQESGCGRKTTMELITETKCTNFRPITRGQKVSERGARLRSKLPCNPMKLETLSKPVRRNVRWRTAAAAACRLVQRAIRRNRDRQPTGTKKEGVAPDLQSSAEPARSERSPDRSVPQPRSCRPSAAKVVSVRKISGRERVPAAHCRPKQDPGPVPNGLAPSGRPIQISRTGSKAILTPSKAY